MSGGRQDDDDLIPFEPWSGPEWPDHPTAAPEQDASRPGTPAPTTFSLDTPGWDAAGGGTGAGGASSGVADAGWPGAGEPGDSGAPSHSGAGDEPGARGEPGAAWEARIPRQPGAPNEPGVPGAGGESGDGDAVAEPVKKGSAVRKAAVLAAGAAASAIALGAGGYTLVKPFLSPDDYSGAGAGAVTIRIAPGANAGDVGDLLANAGVVASARSFVNVTEQRAMADRLRPGNYRLRRGMAAGAALDLLLNPGSRVIKRVTVPEGLRTGETLTKLAKLTGLPLKSLQHVDKGLVGLPEYAHGLEGFLFPATYEVEPGAKAVDVLASMVERFRAAASQIDLVRRAEQVHLTPLEAVTVASIVQAEGGRDKDFPKIARVIYNRLRRDIPLQLDTTVLYAQGRRTLKVSEKDTKVRSPYNTYRRAGLPPGPISNPGEKALMAALHPAKGDWTWFVTTDPAHRITKFTDKESEFVRYREELNEYLGAH